MKSSIIFKKMNALKMLMLTLVASLAILAGTYNVHAASCMDLSDVPLDSLEQAAPGMIMFVLDDSGSMDWSMMCPPPETNGVFDGYEYIFSNPGDDVYTGGSNDDNLEDSSNDRMMWMSQWAEYNGMYYDPATEYTPWPTLTDADRDNPRSNPMNSTHRLDMTDLWHEWNASGVVVDNADPGYLEPLGTWANADGGWNGNYRYATNPVEDHGAQWVVTGLDPAVTYDVEARWLNGGGSRETNVYYDITGNGTDSTPAPGVNQQLNHNTWVAISNSGIQPDATGTITVTLRAISTGASGLCADAVQFVAQNSLISDVARRHYFVRNDTGTYLVNLLGGVIEYYRVNLDNPTDNREIVTAAKLERLADADAAAAGIVTGRSYLEECQNFANWYSFYRRRELTAKNAIANVIHTLDGVYVGLISINGLLAQPVLPVRVNLDGTLHDDSGSLLNTLYSLNISAQGTPLRNGLKNAGRYYQGNYLKPSPVPAQTSDSTYPFFTADKGGSCQQAFTIIFSDGYYNGSSPGVGNADGDDNTDFDGSPFGDTTDNTLADVAMYYFENDLNTTLSDDVAVTMVDPASQQHMVTYTIAFGVTGDLDVELYKDCPLGACPGSWPGTGSNSGKIDDMFHAAVNGRGKYLSASSTAELNEALKALQKDINSRLGAAAALATNSIQLTVGSVVYQGTYNTANWFGEVEALPLSLTTGYVGAPIWRASDHIPAWGSRNILSYSGAAGIVFAPGNLNASQVSQLEASGLGTADQIVDFIRGDTTNHVSNGGALRNRTHPIGDIVHSAPTYFKNVVYIGSNDGMLHAFNSTNGHELFAYVPNLVYGHLAELADPAYSHKYYVDGTATVAKADSKDILVCGLQKGGKGYFALDVTNPTAMGAGDVLWEYPPAADDDLGYSFSRAVIVKTEAAGYVAIFGNGYDSVNGSAVLYVLDALTGSVLKQFDTGVVGCNGLSTPSLVDVELDGLVDYAFAGDLKGNMWKFDLRGGSVANWQFSYQDGATPMPLISVKNAGGDDQPITVAPEVMLDCVVMDEGRGLMVIFGTGQYLNNADFGDTTVQSFYGIWDWGDMWEAKDGFSVAKTKYLGTVNADRSMSNIAGTITLLEQSTVSATGEWGALSDNPIDWYDPFASVGSHMGWFIDLPEPGERSIRDPMLREGTAVLISTIPTSAACTAGGTSWIYQVSACSGGRIPKPVFDVDGDGDIDEQDNIIVFGVPEPPSKWHVDDIVFEPIEVTGNMYLPDSQGDINRMEVIPNLPGMFYWRVLGQ